MIRHDRSHEVSANANSDLLAGHTRVNSCVVVAILFWQISGIGPTCCADEPEVARRVPLPAAWTKEHYAEAIFGSIGLGEWFGSGDELPFGLYNEVNEDPSLPSAIFLGVKDGSRNKLDLSQLSRYPGLRTLAIFKGSHLDQSAIMEIAKCRQLRALFVLEAPINDESLKVLSTSLERLVVLDVSMSEITDNSVSTLIELKELSHLNVSGTSISLQGVEVLRARKPNCTVWTERWIVGHAGAEWHKESLEKWEAAGKKFPK